jgi:transposase
MYKSPYIHKITQKEEQELKKVITKLKSENRMVLRCNIILFSSKGYQVQEIARKLKITSKTVSKWIKRYYLFGIKGLKDKPRSGRAKKFNLSVKYELVHLACTDPDKIFKGLTKWSYRKLVLAMIKLKIVAKISYTRVMSWLKSLKIKPHKIKYYLVQTDPAFKEKMLEIIKLYHYPPIDGPVICLDEKTGIQVLMPFYPDKEVSNGQVVLREYDYIRKGTICVLGGFNVTTGKIIGIVREKHSTKEFIELLKAILLAFKHERKIYIICDNFSTHKSAELLNWLSSFNNPFEFHYLPNHGSWLNQIEIWFGILDKDCLNNAVSNNKLEKAQLILDFFEMYNKNFAHPFKWQYGKDLLMA